MRFFFLAWLFSGCSLLIGNIKPVTEKNSTYKHTDLNSPWKKITLKDTEDQTDITYQNGVTESTISINSSCRKDEKYSAHSLKNLAEVLLMGFDGKKTKNEPITIQGHNGHVVKIESPTQVIKVVLVRKSGCIFDFMFVAKPVESLKDETSFDQFLTRIEF